MTHHEAKRRVLRFLDLPLGRELKARQKAVRAALDAFDAINVDAVPAERLDEFVEKAGIRP